MSKEKKLIKEFRELDFRIRCCRNFTKAEAKRLTAVINELNSLKIFPIEVATEILKQNDQRADEARDLLYGRDNYLEKSRTKKESVVRPVQTRKQRVQAHLAQCKSGYV